VHLKKVLGFSGRKIRLGNWFAPRDGNRSRLLLSNEQHSLSSDFPAGSRAAPVLSKGILSVVADFSSEQSIS
jgi:hypothetical protein